MRAEGAGSRGHKVAASYQSRTTYSVVRDRLPITKGDPSRVPPPRAVPGFLFFPAKTLCGSPCQRTTGTPFLTETPYKITFFVQAKFVSLPMAPVDYKERGGGGGGREGGCSFVLRLRRLIRESHTSFPFFFFFSFYFLSLSTDVHLSIALLVSRSLFPGN